MGNQLVYLWHKQYTKIAGTHLKNWLMMTISTIKNFALHSRINGVRGNLHKIRRGEMASPRDVKGFLSSIFQERVQLYYIKRNMPRPLGGGGSISWESKSWFWLRSFSHGPEFKHWDGLCAQRGPAWNSFSSSPLPTTLDLSLSLPLSVSL